MDIRMLPVYFFLGGAVVTAATYFGSQAKGIVAAFITFLPVMSVVTVCLIYLAGGTGAAISYAKGMLLMLPSWTLYIVSFILLLPRVGLVASLSISVSAYVATAFLVARFS